MALSFDHLVPDNGKKSKGSLSFDHLTPAAPPPKTTVDFVDAGGRGLAHGGITGVRSLGDAVFGLPAVAADAAATFGADALGIDYNHGIFNAFEKTWHNPLKVNASEFDLKPTEEYGTGGQAANMVGDLVGQIAAGLGPASAVRAPATTVGSQVPTIAQELVRHAAPGVVGVQPLAVAHGQDITQRGIDAGMATPDAMNAGAVDALTMSILGALPVSAPGRVLTRAASGAAAGVAGGDLQHESTQALLPEGALPDMTPEDLASMGALGSIFAAALGPRAAAGVNARGDAAAKGLAKHDKQVVQQDAEAAAEAARQKAAAGADLQRVIAQNTGLDTPPPLPASSPRGKNARAQVQSELAAVFDQPAVTPRNEKGEVATDGAAATDYAGNISGAENLANTRQAERMLAGADGAHPNIDAVRILADEISRAETRLAELDRLGKKRGASKAKIDAEKARVLDDLEQTAAGLRQTEQVFNSVEARRVRKEKDAFRESGPSKSYQPGDTRAAQADVAEPESFTFVGRVNKQTGQLDGERVEVTGESFVGAGGKRYTPVRFPDRGGEEANVAAEDVITLARPANPRYAQDLASRVYAPPEGVGKGSNPSPRESAERIMSDLPGGLRGEHIPGEKPNAPAPDKSAGSVFDNPPQPKAEQPKAEQPKAEQPKKVEPAKPAPAADAAPKAIGMQPIPKPGQVVIHEGKPRVVAEVIPHPQDSKRTVMSFKDAPHKFVFADRIPEAAKPEFPDLASEREPPPAEFPPNNADTALAEHEQRNRIPELESDLEAARAELAAFEAQNAEALKAAQEPTRRRGGVGGHVVEVTDANGRTRRTRAGQRFDKDQAGDDLLDAIGRRGGMPRDIMSREGLDPADMISANRRRIGYAPFRKGGTNTLDDLARRLHDEGIIPSNDPHRLLDAIQDVLAGRETNYRRTDDIEADLERKYLEDTHEEMKDLVAKIEQELASAREAPAKDEPPLLESHTSEDLRARDEAAQAAARQEAAKKKAEDEKAKADAAVGEYELTGSARKLDQTPQQSGLLRADGGVEPAAVPKAEPVAAPKAEEKPESTDIENLDTPPAPSPAREKFEAWLDDTMESLEFAEDKRGAMAAVQKLHRKGMLTADELKEIQRVSKDRDMTESDIADEVRSVVGNAAEWESRIAAAVKEKPQAIRSPGNRQGGFLNMAPLADAVRKVIRAAAGDWSTTAAKAEFEEFRDNLKEVSGGLRAKDRLSRRSIAADSFRAILASAEGNLRMLTKNFNSDTAKKLADNFHATAGKDAGATRTFDESTGMESNSRLSRAQKDIFDVIKNAGLRKDKAAYARIVRMVENPQAPRIGVEGRVADSIQKYFEDILAYEKAAGVNVGEVKGYFPHQFDLGTVAGNMAKFEAKAAEAYRAMGSSAADAAFQAKALMDSILYGDSGTPGAYGKTGSAAPTFVKNRKFTPQAYQILDNAGFYTKDIEASIVNYTHRAVKRAEIARRWGDNWSKWGDLEAKMLAEDPAVSQILDQIRDTVGVLTGTNTGQVGVGFQRTLSSIRTWVTLGMLEKSALASMGELLLAPQRATMGDPRHDFAMIGTNLTRHLDSTFRLLTRQGRDQDLQTAFDLAHDVGVIAGEGMASLQAARFMGGDPVGKLNSVALAKFFQRNMLSQLTDYTRVTSMMMGQMFLRRLALDVNSGGPKAKKSEFFLRELGVPAGEEAQFAKWLASQLAGDKYHPASLTGPQGDAYKTALMRFTDQTVQRPTNSTRPKWASHPLGGVVFQLQSFGYAYQKNVINRRIRVASAVGRDVGEDAMKGLGFKTSGQGRGFDAGDALTMGASAAMTAAMALAMQYMLGEGRDKIWGAKDKRELTTQAKIERAMSRQGEFGVVDPYLQAASGVRYARSASSSLTGPGVSSATGALDTFVELAMNNSEVTNSKERAAYRTVWNLFVEPLAQLALTPVPLSPLATAATTLAVPKGQEGFVDMMAGPKDYTAPGAKKPVRGMFEPAPKPTPKESKAADKRVKSERLKALREKYGVPAAG